MSAIADSLEKLVQYVINNLEILTVNHIRSRAKHKLVIENGAGAWIILDGTKIQMSEGLLGNTFDRIYLGSDKLCWIERDPNNGNMTFHLAPGKAFNFERG